MRSYRRNFLAATILLVVMFIVGLGGVLTPRGEVFPFASWFLFVLVPNHTVEYDLEFRAVDEQPLPKPVRFSRSGGLTIQPHSIVGFNVIQQLGKALERGDARKSLDLRRQIDTLCRHGSQMQYDVVKIVYDPASRYETGSTLERRVLGSFSTGE